MMDYECEKVLPYAEGSNKQQQIAQMFDAISDNYDLMNHAMTLGIDRRWRRKSIQSLKAYKPQFILDVATGTGDFALSAFEHLHPQKIIGIDISEKMLEVGRIKIATQGLNEQIELTQGSSMSLPYLDEVFDAVTVAFGLRNFEKLETGIRQMQRVLKKGGCLAILEMTEPAGIYKPFYLLYTKCLIPLLAKIYAKDMHAYSYLPKSINKFPQAKEMSRLLQRCGFASVRYSRFTFGVCTFYLAEK